MKKRAIVSAVAGIALAGVMAVGFAACKETAKSIKGEDVTKETWETAMDFSNYENFKATYSTEGEIKSGDVTISQTAEYTIVLEGDKQYIKGKVKTTVKGDFPEGTPDYVKEMYKGGTEEIEYYINGEEVIAQKDGKWTKLSETEVEMSYKYQVSAQTLIYEIPSEDFEDYEYSADQKGHVLKSTKDKEGCLNVVKIKDGKLKAYYEEYKSEASGSSTTSTTSVVITAYDGQTVTIPEV